MPPSANIADTSKLAEKIKKIDLTLTTAAGDTDSGTRGQGMNGVVMEAWIIPGSGGAAPATPFDVELFDDDNNDILGGLGKGLAVVTPTRLTGSALDYPVLTTGEMTLTLGGNVGGGAGTVVRVVLKVSGKDEYR